MLVNYVLEFKTGVGVKIRKKISLTFFSAIFFSLLGCDVNHFKKCEWTLEGEVDNVEKLSEEQIKEGFIPVCVRNRVTNKQNCNLKAQMSFAKENFKRKFRYDDLDIDKKTAFPRTLRGIKKFCD